MSRPTLHFTALFTAALLGAPALVSCKGDGDDACDTGDSGTDCLGGGGDAGSGDAGSGDAGSGDGGSGDAGGDGGGEAPMWADIADNAGGAFRFEAVNVYGGWNDTDWGWSGLGAEPTNSLSIALAGAPAEGTFALATPDDDDYAVYTDFEHYTVQTGGFVSTGGTVVVRDVEATTYYGADAWRVDGTFEVSMTNEKDPPTLLTVVGGFTDALLIGE